MIIDTEFSPRVMAPIKEKIERIFGRSDWAYVINTHAHDNHAGGNSLFPGATIVGHDNVAAEMQPWVHRQTDPDIKQQELDRGKPIHREPAGLSAPSRAESRPDEDDRGRNQVLGAAHAGPAGGLSAGPADADVCRPAHDRFGRSPLELFYFGKGHSNSDILIYVPQERLLVTGAVVYQRAHVPEVAEETTLQDVHRFLAVLDRFAPREVKIDHVVPAHSVPLEKKDLLAVRDYYQRMLVGVQAAQQEGLTLEQTMNRLALKTNFPAFRDPPGGLVPRLPRAQPEEPLADSEGRTTTARQSREEAKAPHHPQP